MEENNLKRSKVSEAITSLGVVIAVIADIYFTKHLICLWALFFIPMIYATDSVNNKDKNKEKKKVKDGKTVFVYVVTYWDDGEEPVVTVFDNYEAAKLCHESFAGCHTGCCLDTVLVYNSFTNKKKVK